MRQYLEVKQAYDDALLFFRLGDFYEMFFEDAERAADLLDITLTSRNRNDPNPIPMCGVPYHSARPYIARLLEAGVKVALCEQVEAPGKGIVRREVSRVITPGTSLDEETLAPDRGNYLASVSRHDQVWGLAWVEFSTGQVGVTTAPDFNALGDELAAVSPAELLLDAAARAERSVDCEAMLPRTLLVDVPEQELETELLDYLPRDQEEASRAALENLLKYLARNQGGKIEHLCAPESYELGAFVQLDNATRVNLELVDAVGGGKSGSLLSVIDGSVTAMGKRLVRQWLLRPLADASSIGRRLDGVETFVEAFSLRSDLRGLLATVGDLERLTGRVGAGTASPRDIDRVASALEATAAMSALLSRNSELMGRCEELDGYVEKLDALPEITERVRHALVDEPPAAIGKGELIREGFSEEVDRLRAISSDGKGWMAGFEAAERERTGISTLRIRYNKVFGYFIEAPKSASDRIPAEYDRKQTVANAERYITPSLKEREKDVLGAEERLHSLESHLFDELKAFIAVRLDRLNRTARSLAAIDAVAGFADKAHTNGWVRPEILQKGRLDIEAGRHPVVEAAIGRDFVPNDCKLGGEDGPLSMVITGPNMAGKSTYLRQVALIAIMAHTGTFVPATRAVIPLVDRVFTRIGASDNLARGQSTFMVEMTETAEIIRNMTDRSLVILDEIGRGTSTFDGISIAWAVAEKMVRSRVKTLFATHYHELAELAHEQPDVENFSVAVRRYKGKIIFLYRVAPGPASGSYGIEVARLAGVPDDVIDRAKSMLSRFEGAGALRGDQQPSLFSMVPTGTEPAAERDEETAERYAELEKRLENVDVNRVTPVEALTILDELVHDLRKVQ